MTNDTAAATDQIIIDVPWADWNNTLPETTDSKRLAAAIEAELNAYVKSGEYPEGTRFVRWIEGGLQGKGPMNPQIEVSLPSVEGLFDFYTAYCGGDSMQAEDELEEFYGYTAPEGWTPKR